MSNHSSLTNSAFSEINRTRSSGFLTVRGKNARTLAPGRRQVNMIETRKREHSRKPDEQYAVIEACSRGPFLELFARGTRPGWTYWGNQATDDYKPTWETYANHSQAGRVAAE